MITHDLEKAIVEKLSSVIDPETGVDVMRMKLVQNLRIEDTGKVAYVFRPSSPLCPIAIPLALDIIQAVYSVKGVTGQSVTVVDYIQADRLNEMLEDLLKSDPL